MSKMLVNAYQLNSNQIKHVYLENERLKKDIINFKPFLGYHVLPGEVTNWTDMYGKPIKVKEFDSITDMRKWKKDNKNVFEILGDVEPVDMFVASMYKGDIELNRKGLKVFNLDIEVFVEGGGFPKATEAKHPINAITINEMGTNVYISFFVGHYNTQNDNETCIECNHELDLIEKFLNFWDIEEPQIITGWAINTFDIPYLVNRIKQFSPELVKKLSVDRIITSSKKTDSTGKEHIYYSLQGHIIWDYIELYKKYTLEKRESYSLDNIAAVELGNSKIKFHDDYDNLNELYLKDPQKFLEYNIKDTALVYELDKKLDYINLAMSIMHKAKCQANKIFGTLSPWDCIIYNELLSRKILCPPSDNYTKVEFVGGFVAEPIVGLHDWTMVYDIVSSYPNQIRSYNLSPETAISENNLTAELLEIKQKYTGIDICADVKITTIISKILQEHQVSFTSNGYFFDISKEGIIPSIFTKFFNLRKKYKKEMKEYKAAGKDREAKIADLYQYTIKILLNSGYGALSNNYSRYFDIRIGEAVTSNGQIACKGMINTIEQKLGIPVIYADTDSNFISLAGVLKDRFKDKEVDNKTKVDFLIKYSQRCIEPVLNEFFQKLKVNMNMRELTIAAEPECIADITLFTGKKRYIMNKLWDEGTYLIDNPKRKIRGIEIVRSSTPKIVRDTLKQAVELIFTTKSNEVLIEFIDAFRIEFNQLPIEIISFPRSTTFGNYKINDKGLPIGVCAALSYNEYLKKLSLDQKYISIADGDKIKYCYIKQPNAIKSHVIGFINKLPNEMKDTFKIDYDKQFNKSFLVPLNTIFKAIGWSIEKKQQTLEDFFD